MWTGGRGGDQRTSANGDEALDDLPQEGMHIGGLSTASLAILRFSRTLVLGGLPPGWAGPALLWTELGRVVSWAWPGCGLGSVGLWGSAGESKE